MRKPVNPVALVNWLLAAGVLLVGLIRLVVQMRQDLQQLGSLVPFAMSLWIDVQGVLVTPAALLALGTLVELIDQIRWNALSPDDRRIRKPIRRFVARLRQAGRDY